MSSRLSQWAWTWAASLLLAALPMPAAVEVQVDAGRVAGSLRPLHGVNLGPLCYRGTVDLTPYHREIAVPYTRLHDVVWLNAHAVDISTIFRDFRNDPGDPASYDFAATDDYLAAITNAGSRIIYRLGESIEHTPRQYRVHPPPDPAKWAEICLGIIRHYNEGWANGFRHGIEYWEIWNEPEVRPAMWTGTDAQYFELYRVTAQAIKSRFPGLKVGGPALGYTGDFSGTGAFRPGAFATNFLGFCRREKAPLDFFSWHRYTSDPWDIPRRARAIRRLLDDYGFARTESHFNEWNYLPDDDWRPMLKEGQGRLREQWYRRMSGAEGAAFAACGLILLQTSPVDVANFYTGEIQGFGLFNYHGVPNKNYFAFKAFSRMLETPQRLEAEGKEGRFAVLAARSADGRRVQVMLANFKEADGEFRLGFKALPWRGGAEWELQVVDEKRELETVARGRMEGAEASLSVSLPPPSVGLLRLVAEQGGRH